MRQRPRILITTGDPDGIGVEVAVKALLCRKPTRKYQFVLFRPLSEGRRIAPLRKNYKVATVADFEASLDADVKTDIVDIGSMDNPAFWVEQAGRACLAGAAVAMVTGPLSKSTILQAGYQAIGHTEILSALSKTKDLQMGFIGEKFHVVLASGHIPISRVANSLTENNLLIAIRRAQRISILGRGKRKPIGVVGLNPHAGEGGIIGQEDALVARAVQKAQRQKIRCVGPLVPDAAFLPEQTKKFGCFVACYHDQGLIPFKMAHGHSGVHVTLGLPFIRTSVDHGTAKDIYGKGKANATSMLNAIELAIRLSEQNFKGAI